MSTRIQIDDPNDETQHFKILHQFNALLISFMGVNALSVQRSEASVLSNRIIVNVSSNKLKHKSELFTV